MIEKGRGFTESGCGFKNLCAIIITTLLKKSCICHCLILSSALIAPLMEINLVLHMYTGQRSRLVGVQAAHAVVGDHSSDDFMATKESRRFPEMPALPPLVRVCSTQ